ncbi:hypothetical protein PFISCL1PPCAC_13241, partial [Pristionchus fissidentatus]
LHQQFAIVLLIVKVVNSKRGVIGSNLSYRFQVRENIVLSRMMLPLMILCFVFQMCLTPFIFLVRLCPAAQQDPFLSIFLLGTALFPFSFAVLLLSSNPMRRALETVGISAPKPEEKMDDRTQYEKWLVQQAESWR